MPLIPGAPQHRLGFLQARPGDVAGREGLTVIDVRSDRELEADGLGHIHQVLQVPLPELLSRGAPALDPAAPVVVVCQNGRASEQAAAALVRAHGFLEVYHLVGGMVRWAAEERPVARRRTWRRLGD
jgi:rhodanese-related sulfurtransferase